MDEYQLVKSALLFLTKNLERQNKNHHLTFLDNLVTQYSLIHITNFSNHTKNKNLAINMFCLAQKFQKI